MGEPYRDDWRHEAACLVMDPEIFHPSSADVSTRERTALALATCRTCTVAAECLAEALRLCDDGIRGGTTEVERIAMRRKQQRRKAS